MTPADRLTRAADTLDALADAATPGPWWNDRLGALNGNEMRGEGGSLSYRTITRFHDMCDEDRADRALIALTSDPVTVRLIAALLRDEGEWHATGMALDMPSDQFLALADHIDGKGLDGDDAHDLLEHVDHLTAEIKRLRAGIETFATDAVSFRDHALRCSDRNCLYDYSIRNQRRAAALLNPTEGETDDAE